MNIQQYYEQSAMASLNGSLVAFIPTIVLVVFVFVTHTYYLLLLLLPFLIYSFFCYQKFLLNQRRSKAVKLSSLSESQKPPNLFFEKQLLITFLPAPSLRLLLFATNGIKIGEMRDLCFSPVRWFLPYFIDRLIAKKFGLYDQDGELINVYHFYHDRIEVLNNTGEVISKVVKMKNKEKITYILENKSITIGKNILQTDYDFEDQDGNKIAKITTGWMPIEWGERFVNTNTPILELENHCTRSDTIQLFSLLISIYTYYNH